MCVGIRVPQYVWSEDNLQELVVSLYHVGSKHFYLLSRFTILPVIWHLKFF